MINRIYYVKLFLGIYKKRAKKPDYVQAAVTPFLYRPPFSLSSLPPG
jgi:hypothetical protein